MKGKKTTNYFRNRKKNFVEIITKFSEKKKNEICTQIGNAEVKVYTI